MKDIINGIFLFVLMVFLYFQANLIDGESRSGLDALLLPKIIIGFVALLSLILIIQGFVKYRQKKTGKSTFSFKASLKKYQEVLIVFVSFGIYVLLLNPLGFILATLFLLFTLTAFIVKPRSIKRWIVLSIYNISFTLFIYYVFTVVLRVMLPKLS